MYAPETHIWSWQRFMRLESSCLKKVLAAMPEPFDERIATIANSLIERYAEDAITVAEKQEIMTTGYLAEIWSAVIKYLENPHEPVMHVVRG